MRRLPILLLVLLLAAACRSGAEPEPEAPPDRFPDILDGKTGGNYDPFDLGSQPAIKATVTAVDPKLNILILSVGRDDGVRVGYTLTVYRGNEYVTKVVVDRVEADWCSCYSVRNLQKSPPVVGDLATTRF